MTAAADGHMDIVKMLLQHNANVALKDAQGWKAADHAVMNGIHRYNIVHMVVYGSIIIGTYGSIVVYKVVTVVVHCEFQ